MNEKEKLDMEHYRILIEKRKFDEYDIIGFLILIREHIDENVVPIFHDFANGVAHRKRNRGIIYDNIYGAVLNNYAKNNDGSVTGYSGISYHRWEQECKIIAQQFNIHLTRIVMKELLICMISIFHRSKYETSQQSPNKQINIRGSLEIIISSNGNLSYATSDDINNICVCFIKIDDLQINKNRYNNFIRTPVKTYRKNGFLYLKDGFGDILKVTKRK